jgi:AcrR family transcriptional regulator
MPHQTFYNLSPERQQEILLVAYREFTMNDYRTASLSRIVKELNLAKGSFYRYFSSKKELYFYLLEKATEIRYKTLDQRISEYPSDLFELIVVNWRDKIRFEREHAVESGFIYRMMQERHNEEIGSPDLQNKQMIVGKIKQMLASQYAAGIRQDIDPDLIAFLIAHVQIGFYDYLTLKHNDDIVENLRKNEPIYVLDDDSIDTIIQGFTTLLKEGIAKKYRP